MQGECTLSLRPGTARAEAEKFKWFEWCGLRGERRGGRRQGGQNEGRDAPETTRQILRTLAA